MKHRAADRGALFESVTRVLRKKAVLYALFVLIYLLPFLFILSENSPQGTVSIPLTNRDYLRHYTGARNIAEGNTFFFIRDSMVSKGVFTYLQPVPSYIYGFVIKMVGFNPNLAYLLTLFIFSSFLFWSSVTFNQLFTDDRAFAAIVAVLMYTVHLGTLWFWKPFSLYDNLPYTKLVNPIMTAPFLLIFLYHHYKSAFTYKPGHSILSGALLSLLLFSYTHFWNFAFAYIFVLLVYKCIENKHEILGCLKGLKPLALLRVFTGECSVLLVALPALIIYARNYVSLGSYPFLAEYFSRNFVMFTYEFIKSSGELIAYIVPSLVLISLYILVGRETFYKKRYFLLVILFVSAFFAHFINVVTGINTQRHHISHYIVFPLLILFASLLLKEAYIRFLYKRLRVNLNDIFVLLVIFNLLVLVPRTVIWASNHTEVSIREPQIIQLTDFLNSLPDTRITAAERESLDISAYTRHDTIYVDHLEFVSNQEYCERFLMFFLMQDYPPDELVREISPDKYFIEEAWGWDGGFKSNILKYVPGESFEEKKDFLLRIYDGMLGNGLNHYINKYSPTILITTEQLDSERFDLRKSVGTYNIYWVIQTADI